MAGAHQRRRLPALLPNPSTEAVQVQPLHADLEAGSGLWCVGRHKVVPGQTPLTLISFFFQFLPTKKGGFQFRIERSQLLLNLDDLGFILLVKTGLCHVVV